MAANFNNVINIAQGFFQFNFHPTSFAGGCKCDNQYWGTLDFSSNNHNEKRLNLPITATSNSKIIIIIGESPHIDEYDFSKNPVCSKGPMYMYDPKIIQLLNATTLKINNQSTFSGLKGVYDVFLLNAIPYQCSFGLKLYGVNNFNNQKNEVFSLAWNIEPFQQDLIDEILSILNMYQAVNDIIILNSCTNLLKKCCNSSALTFLLNSYGKHICNVLDERHIYKW